MHSQGGKVVLQDFVFPPHCWALPSGSHLLLLAFPSPVELPTETRESKPSWYRSTLGPTPLLTTISELPPMLKTLGQSSSSSLGSSGSSQMGALSDWARSASSTSSGSSAWLLMLRERSRNWPTSCWLFCETQLTAASPQNCHSLTCG